MNREVDGVGMGGYEPKDDNQKNLIKLPNRGDLVGVTPHPSDPAQAFPHTGYPHWGIPMWEGPLPNKYNLEWKAWVTKYL